MRKGENGRGKSQQGEWKSVIQKAQRKKMGSRDYYFVNDKE
jgi:hypothetical protein